MGGQQLLRDADIEPTGEKIAQALGAASGAYATFINRLQNHGVAVNWRYYSDGKAWLGKGQYAWVTTRGTQKETTAFWLSVWDGFFKVTIFIPEKHRADALNDATKAMIQSAKQMGKLKFFPLVFDLYTDEMFDAVFILIDFRKALK